MRVQVEAEADSLAAKLKVDFGRAGEDALPSEESLVGQSADDHVYKVRVQGRGRGGRGRPGGLGLGDQRDASGDSWEICDRLKTKIRKALRLCACVPPSSRPGWHA